MLFRIYSAESPRRAHPDRFASTIVEGIVSDLLRRDPYSLADIHATVGHNGSDYVHISGNISSDVSVEELRETTYEWIRDLARRLGYNNQNGFDPVNFSLEWRVAPQSQALQTNGKRTAVGDSRTVAGYACNETVDLLLPKAVVVAQKISDALDKVYTDGTIPYLGPDGKVQVTYRGGKKIITIHAQHKPNINRSVLEKQIIEHIVEPIVGNGFEVKVNSPVAPFAEGGPRADAGESNEKLCAYGEAIPRYGGIFWGKDPTKPEVFAFLKARQLAVRNLIISGADRCYVELAYSIGNPHPDDILIDTEPSTNGAHYEDDELLAGNIIKEFNLRDPEVFSKITASRLIGELSLPWEKIA